MAERTIESPKQPGQFPPMISIRNPGDFVKGQVIGTGITANGNPVVSLALIDLKGNTQKSVSKGVYEEVEVEIGAIVQLVGSVYQLKEKLPQLQIGDVVTVTFLGKKKMKAGRSLNDYTVVVVGG